MLTDPAGTNDVTRDIIGCGIKVHKALGPGLLESAYVPCLALELTESGHAVELRKPVPLVYRSVTLDVCYWLDMLVARCVVVELKSVEALAPIHEAQMLTYLAADALSSGTLDQLQRSTVEGWNSTSSQPVS